MLVFKDFIKPFGRNSAITQLIVLARCSKRGKIVGSFMFSKKKSRYMEHTKVSLNDFIILNAPSIFRVTFSARSWLYQIVSLQYIQLRKL